jgi:hypothetical protein
VASTPEDIAEVVAFLVDPGPRHMTGSIVPVDAGFRLLVSIARRMLDFADLRGRLNTEIPIRDFKPALRSLMGPCSAHLASLIAG